MEDGNIIIYIGSKPETESHLSRGLAIATCRWNFLGWNIRKLHQYSYCITKTSHLKLSKFCCRNTKELSFSSLYFYCLPFQLSFFLPLPPIERFQLLKALKSYFKFQTFLSLAFSSRPRQSTFKCMSSILIRSLFPSTFG